jgi:hypothetical protein
MANEKGPHAVTLQVNPGDLFCVTRQLVDPAIQDAVRNYCTSASYVGRDWTLASEPAHPGDQIQLAGAGIGFSWPGAVRQTM